MDIPETLNAEYIDSQYKLWKKDPDQVSKDWQIFFKGFEIGNASTGDIGVGAAGEDAVMGQARVEALKLRYRDIGHLLACLDPLSACPTDHPLLSLSQFDLTPDDLDRTFITRRFSKSGQAQLRDIVAALKRTYCTSIGVEFMHIQDPDERGWLQERMESTQNQPDIKPERKVRILEKLMEATLFEQFLHKKYIGQTRFSLEGGEALIAMLDEIIETSADAGCDEVILGMAHRGRLNVQAHILKKPYEEIFHEFENCYDPDSLFGSGDVKYHNGYLANLKDSSGRDFRMFLVPNPSHLESVNPVVEGIARARRDMSAAGAKSGVMPLLLHGDAAFAGQGIVSETLNMSMLQGYQTGGTIHCVINNQIGYTTLPEDARSTRYSTDIAKMLMVPIFHVHGENPEAVMHVARLAVDYRMKFSKDVVIDLICYRRYGHNEGDEPYFTQPLMYQRIKDRPAVYEIYQQTLIDQNAVDASTIEAYKTEINGHLESAHKSATQGTCVLPDRLYFDNWKGYHGQYSFEKIDTGVSGDQLKRLSMQLNGLPEDFTAHPKLKRMLDKRLSSVEEGHGIDWATGESLAFASLLSEKLPIRLSGQDVRRGTFSQRHCDLIDFKTGQVYSPINNLSSDQSKLQAYNSLLSESGVLGFEYGYSLARPEGLVIWEAQFGDFSNNAQAIIDLFIASGESKWHRFSGLVMLLPHGLEGLGPEHSSARPERFLQLCSDNNLQICNLTNPAQYFHLLRRQALANYRKPLILLSPKSLLRHPMAVSDLSDLISGHYQPVIDDEQADRGAERVLLCSGKLYYDLYQRRSELNASDIAIIRVEQYYPFPGDQLEKIFQKYSSARQWFWVQEEPANMGAWNFIWQRLESLSGHGIGYIGRKTSSSPATGYPHIYRREQASIIEQAVGSIPDSD